MASALRALAPWLATRDSASPKAAAFKIFGAAGARGSNAVGSNARQYAARPAAVLGRGAKL